MPIVFSENFQNDTPESIVLRYPGSTRNSAGVTDIPTSWPLRGNSVLQTNVAFDPEVNTRFEVLMLTQANLVSAGTGSISIFGIPIVGGADNITIAGISVPAIPTASSINFIVELKGTEYRLTVLADGSPIIKPTLVEWTFSPTVSGTYDGWLAGFPNWLDGVIVGVDTPAETYLGDAQWNQLALTVVDPGDWEFTDVGYVEDTDKSNPLEQSPSIRTLSNLPIVFSKEPGTYTQIYGSSFSKEPNTELTIDGNILAVGADPTVFPPILVNSGSFEVALVGPGPEPDDPEIGDYYKGGYYAGLMKNPDTGEMWRLIVAPKSGETNVAWKTSRTTTPNTDSVFDGLANTQAMEAADISLHPAAQHCVNYVNDGYDDWYLPARDELELLYRSFKPSTLENIVGDRSTQAGGGLQGENNNSVPVGPAYTLDSPGQTPIVQFKEGGPEALDTATNYYLCSTQSPLNVERCMIQRLPSNGEQLGSLYKNANTAYTRPVRREAYIPQSPPGPGEQGFGVGIAPEEWLAPLGLSEMTGTTDKTSDNYGNYQHTNGSICVFVPKFYYRIGSTESPRYPAYGANCIDIALAEDFADEAEANAAGYALHRAFIDDGKEKPGFFYDKYLASRDGTTVKSVKNGQPISLTTAPGYVTSVGIPGCTGILADAVVASRARGYGWNCVSIFMADAIAKLSLAHGQYSTSAEFCAWYDSEGLTNFPKGCNNNALGDTNDPSVTFVSSGESNANKPLTGSASNLAKTTHNGQACGITDVNGAMQQATIGVTQFGTSATSATQVTTGDCYVLKTTAKHANLTGGWNGATDAWGNTTGLANNFDVINSFLPWGSATGYINFGNGSNQVFAFYLDNNDYRKLRADTGVQGSPNFMSAEGISLFGNDGCYQFGRHNLVPMVAGSWGLTSRAGVFYRIWSAYRSMPDAADCFRAGAYGD